MSLPAAREQFIDALDRADRGLTYATQQAAEAVRGLVYDGPVKLVGTEKAALIRCAEHSEARTARWQQASNALDDLYALQRDERDQAAQANEQTKQQVEPVRAEVAEPLTAQAREALTDWQAADAAEKTTHAKVSAAGRFKKRRATAEHDTAQGVARNAKWKLMTVWGEPPRWNENQAAWVERVTRPRIEAEQQRAKAAHGLHAAMEPNPWPSIAVYARIFGEVAVRKNPGIYINARPTRQVDDATRTAQHARAEAKALRAPPAEAVERITQTPRGRGERS